MPSSIISVPEEEVFSQPDQEIAQYTEEDIIDDNLDIQEESQEQKPDKLNSKSPLSDIAEQICQKRYYQRDENGNVIEDWHGLVTRVVNHVCQNEDQEFKDEMFDLIYNTKFLPNSPCLVNAGKRGNRSGLCACFVSPPPEDSWEGMIDNIRRFGQVARVGGGNGVDLSKIRPEGDKVWGSTHAKACGPIRHMQVISAAMDSITQSGFRGMANLASMRVDHPDIEKFIVCKQRKNALKSMLREDIFSHYDQLVDQTHDHLNIVLDKFISNFNISVLATDDFMKKVENDELIDLVFAGEKYRTVRATDLFHLISENAWKNGDPGLLFYNEINNNPYKYSGQEVTAANPCGEETMPPFGVCVLGSIDISKYCKDESVIEWHNLKKDIRSCTQFLDDIIDANIFPNDDFKKWGQDNRPIGLGLMGFADLLLKMKIAYGSKKSRNLASEIMLLFKTEAHKKSVEMAKKRGTPQSCNYNELEFRRNVTTLCIAPTGSISLLAGCSSSIEPIFSPTIYRYDNTGSYEIPHECADKSYFRSAINKKQPDKEVTWREHVEMQSAFQEHIDASTSKTINMPNSATIEDVKQAYMLAWKLKCRGITVYRDGCKTTQVLNTSKKKTSHINNAPKRPESVTANIFKTTAIGHDWHIIVGMVEDNPYELFAVNGKQDLPKTANIVKRKKRHYSLVDEKGEVLIDNISKEEDLIDPKINMETRRFSLELRHGIPAKFIVEQIDKSNEVITSFSKAVGRVFKNHFLSEEENNQLVSGVPCPECSKVGRYTTMVSEAGCLKCPLIECSYSKCG